MSNSPTLSGRLRKKGSKIFSKPLVFLNRDRSPSTGSDGQSSPHSPHTPKSESSSNDESPRKFFGLLKRHSKDERPSLLTIENTSLSDEALADLKGLSSSGRTQSPLGRPENVRSNSLKSDKGTNSMGSNSSQRSSISSSLQQIGKHSTQQLLQQYEQDSDTSKLLLVSTCLHNLSNARSLNTSSCCFELSALPALDDDMDEERNSEDELNSVASSSSEVDNSNSKENDQNDEKTNDNNDPSRIVVHLLLRGFSIETSSTVTPNELGEIRDLSLLTRCQRRLNLRTPLRAHLLDSDHLALTLPHFHRLPASAASSASSLTTESLTTDSLTTDGVDELTERALSSKRGSMAFATKKCQNPLDLDALSSLAEENLRLRHWLAIAGSARASLKEHVDSNESDIASNANKKEKKEKIKIFVQFNR